MARAIRGGAPEHDDADSRAEDARIAELVRRIQAGDQELFAEVYELYFDRVYAYLRVMLRDRHEAEDATQQVFTQVFEALPRYQQRRQPFRAWLFVVARNYALSRLRKHGREQPTEEAKLDSRRNDAGFEAPPALSWVSDGDLVVLIERLPLPQRQVLVLRFMLGLSSAEVGEILERSEGSVRMLQSRALAYLRERLTAASRAPKDGTRAPLRRWPRQAGVLRARRFALLSPGPVR
jgi:RNA polymerase sigma-70 factor, ECF subfamily